MAPVGRPRIAHLSDPKDSGGASIAIGVFDGVHLGHRYLFERMVEESAREGLSTTCLTLDPDPELVLHPERTPQALCSLDARVSFLRSAGIERVDVLPFTNAVADQSAFEFLSWVQRAQGLRALWAGSDFALGKDRSGTLKVIEEIGRSLGFKVCAVPPLQDGGRVISSTWIRESLEQGDVHQAMELLGRPYAIEGQVAEGARRGRLLGFPTANVIPPLGRALPADGVYVVRVLVKDVDHYGVANLGARPTFDENQRLLETHLLDFDGDLYGDTLEIQFLERLRGVERFPTVDDLRAQIGRDVVSAREAVTGLVKSGPSGESRGAVN